MADADQRDFNSHAHVERDKKVSGTASSKINFNSHAHVERDFTDIVLTMPVKISTHTLTWSVTCSGQETNLAQWISTHTLTWSVTKPSMIAPIILGFQLTRSRGA